jgi:hypothetical protein
MLSDSDNCFPNSWEMSSLDPSQPVRSQWLCPRDKNTRDRSLPNLRAGRPDYTVYCGEWGVGRIYRHFQKRMPYGLFVPDVPV